MLLIGDFFSTPYALRGVEWTLRVEIMFYLFMGILKWLQLMDARRFLLPWVLVLATIGLIEFAPFPVEKHWAHGYLTIYGPFLFLGAMWYLWEQKQISLTFLMLYIVFFMLQHYNLIEAHQPYWLKAPFGTLAVCLFALAWWWRDKLQLTAVTLLLSELTYAVYLFHNWLWDWIAEYVNAWAITFIPASVQIILLLLLFCYAMVLLVERPGIRLGKRVVEQLRGSAR